MVGSQRDDPGGSLRSASLAGDLSEQRSLTSQDDSTNSPPERPLEPRPRLGDIVGHAAAVERLKLLVGLARTQGRALPHVLLTGRASIGKKTLATALANEMGTSLVTSTGPSIDKVVDLMGVLTNLGDRDILFLDETDRLSHAVEKALCEAMQDLLVPFVMDRGPNARTMSIPIRPFTYIGAASKTADVPERLRVCFPVIIELNHFSEADLASLAHIFARDRGLALTSEAAALIARHSGREPQHMKNILDLAERPETGPIGPEGISKALAILGRPLPGPGEDLLNLGEITQLSGLAFEARIGALLERFGFQVLVTQATSDGGIDIVATLDRPLVGGRYLVQCKRYASESLVGVQALREFYGTLVADRTAVKGLFVTTSGFTVQAREFAKTLPIELIDGAALRALLNQANDSGSAGSLP